MPPMRLTRNLRAVWRLLRLLSHLVKGLLKIAFLFPRYSQAQKDQAVQIWALALLKRLGITLRVLGQAPLTGPVLLAANHISWLDIIVMHAARHCRFISKDDIARWPVVGTLATAAGTCTSNANRGVTLCGWFTRWRSVYKTTRYLRCFPRARQAMEPPCCPFTPTYFKPLSLPTPPCSPSV